MEVELGDGSTSSVQGVILRKLRTVLHTLLNPVSYELTVGYQPPVERNTLLVHNGHLNGPTSKVDIRLALIKQGQEI